MRHSTYLAIAFITKHKAYLAKPITKNIRQHVQTGMHEPQICAVVSAMETRHKNRKYIHKNGSNRKFKKEGPQEKISKF